MATAEHNPAVTTVTVPETFTLTLSRTEAEAVAFLSDNTRGHTAHGKAVATISAALRRAGLGAYATDDLTLSADTYNAGSGTLTSLTIEEN